MSLSLEPDPLVIAIDGPSGSGKSTVAKQVAAQLGLGYLDTGAMYRALAWDCLRKGIDTRDSEAVGDAAATMLLTMGTNPQDPWVKVAGQEVSEEIRSSHISEIVSEVATNTIARPIMQERQRADLLSIARGWGGVVVEGRDITTVVAPDAQVRVLLTASEEARLARRAKEVRGSDDAAAIAATRDEVVRRDADDSTVSQFTSAADGVTTIDTTSLDLPASVQSVLDVVAASPR